MAMAMAYQRLWQDRYLQSVSIVPGLHKTDLATEHDSAKSALVRSEYLFWLQSVIIEALILSRT